jgi:hypothetical protein
MSVTRQWAREIERFAPSCASTCTRRRAPHRRELVEVARSSDVVITSYDIATRDIETPRWIRWDGCCSTRRRTSRTPPPSGRALRRLDARRTSR